jgi:hypothetical protein
MSRSPSSRAGHVARRLLATGALLLAAALAAAGCSPPAAVASFDPATPCPAEGQQPGAYPDLEAMLPLDVDGTGPGKVDSGRTCTRANLGALADQGVEELRFAGATWKTGGTSGLTIAVFQADGLTPEQMLAFYEQGAGEARRTDRYVVSETIVGGERAQRLDVLGTDGTGQTVVTWQVPGEDVVRVLLAADVGDARVAELLETLGSP